MTSKYELPFSTSYVPDWTFIEAFRELFQNALDNEITTPENTMGFKYDLATETLTVTNKSSALELDTLLLGSTSKASDANTIGRHGEGYKIAFLVLLREGKTITVQNYGKREIWTTKLVKSKRYNNQLVPTIYVDKTAMWKKVPDNNLTIEVGNITKEEYQAIVVKNLNLQTDVVGIRVPKYGKILTAPSEKGNLYVKGLYICHNDDVSYGYDFEPGIIQLDRDRRLIASFDLAWNTSAMWKIAYAQKDMRNDFLGMVSTNASDIQYIKSNSVYNHVPSGTEDGLANDIAKGFIRKHGADAIPVTNNDELQAAQSAGSKAVMVSETEAHYIRRSDIEIQDVPAIIKVWEKFDDFINSIADKLDDNDLEWANTIKEEIKTLEE